MTRRRKPADKERREEDERLLEKMACAGLTTEPRRLPCGEVYDFVLRWIEREDSQHEM